MTLGISLISLNVLRDRGQPLGKDKCQVLEWGFGESLGKGGGGLPYVKGKEIASVDVEGWGESGGAVFLLYLSVPTLHLSVSHFSPQDRGLEQAYLSRLCAPSPWQLCHSYHQILGLIFKTACPAGGGHLYMLSEALFLFQASQGHLTKGSQFLCCSSITVCTAQCLPSLAHLSPSNHR